MPRRERKKVGGYIWHDRLDNIECIAGKIIKDLLVLVEHEDDPKTLRWLTRTLGRLEEINKITLELSNYHDEKRDSEIAAMTEQVRRLADSIANDDDVRAQVEELLTEVTIDDD